MEQIKLKAALRDETGKQEAKKLRRQGLVPGIVYHRGDKPVSISIVDKEISKIFHDAHSENVLINLEIAPAKGGSAAHSGGKARPVIVKEVQHDPVKRNILHVDFNEISLTEKIIVEVELEAQGEPIGVKQDGGVLDHPLRILKLRCLPVDIPKHIDVDVAALKLNDSIHVRDLKLSEKLEVLTDPEALLFQVKPRVEEKVEEVAAETPEVEVIREKKEEEAKPGAPAEKTEKKEEPKAPEKK